MSIEKDLNHEGKGQPGPEKVAKAIPAVEMLSEIDISTKKINGYLESSIIYRGVKAIPADISISVSGFVIQREHKKQVVKYSSDVRKPIVDNINVSFGLFVFFTLISDFFLFCLAALCFTVFPKTNTPLLYFHEAGIFLVLCGLLFHSGKEIWEQHKPEGEGE